MVGPDPYWTDFQYDSIGNITQAVGTGTVAGTYTYHPTKKHAVTAAGANTYSYDPAGNMTTRSTGTGTQTLVYDIQNRLQAITGAGADLNALYDAEGNRVKRVLDGDATYYLGDTYEQDIPATGPQHVTVHFTHSGMTVGSSIDGTLWVTAADHLGSTNITRNTAGTTSQQRYTPHGTRRGGGGNTLPVDRTYTGQTDDPGTGLIDYNARHYDPALGRFTQPDTILDGLNRYTYTRNNPLNATDPTGHCTTFDTTTRECIFQGSDWRFVQDTDDIEQEGQLSLGGGARLDIYGDDYRRVDLVS